MAKVTLGNTKRGDTFLLACTYKENATPVDLSDFDIQSQVRDSMGALVEQLVVSLADQGTAPGVFTLAPSSNPPDWPVDLLTCDVQFTKDGVVRSTQTFEIPVEQDITRSA